MVVGKRSSYSNPCEKCCLAVITVIISFLLSCGQQKIVNPYSTINGYITYTHNFNVNSNSDPGYWPGIYSGLIGFSGSVPFQIHVASDRPDTLAGNGETIFNLNGYFYDGTMECFENGGGHNQVSLFGIVQYYGSDSQSVMITFDETWYNPGSWTFNCMPGNRYNGNYEPVHNVFSAKFALQDSFVVELDSTIQEPGSPLQGEGTYRWIMHITNNN